MLGEILYLDQRLFEVINGSFSNSVFDFIFPLITDLHKSIYFQVLIYPGFLFFLYKKYSINGLKIFFCSLLTLAISDVSANYLFKKNFKRERPEQTFQVKSIIRSPASGYSFVSNHATNMFAFACFISFFFSSFKFWFYLIATLIAYSRVYNGVHFPLDVICGGIWGVVVAKLFYGLTKKWVKI